MQLLPLSYIKDAARSVKRICEEMFKETDSSVFIELLGIRDLTVTMFCLRKEGDQEVLHLQCAHRDDVAICPHCDTTSENIHEAKKRCVRHLDIWGKKTFLHFFSRRFMCECCEKPFTESLSFVEKCQETYLSF